MLPTIARGRVASTARRAVSPSAPTSGSWAQDAYERLPRARAHTPGTLRALRRATSASQRRGGVPTPPTPTELQAAIPTWTSRRSFLRVIRALTRQPYVVQLCRAAGIATDTWAAIIANDAIGADTATGRGARATQVVAGAIVQRCPKQVQRARKIAIQLGVMVEVYRGRELTKAERLALVAVHPRHQQRGLPSVYHLTVCGPRQRARIGTPRAGEFAPLYPPPIANVHLPPVGGLSLLTHLQKLLPLAAAAAPDEPEPPPAAPHRRKRRPGMALAVDVLAHPTLARVLDVRPGTLAAQLAPYAAGGWGGRSLAVEVLREIEQLGVPTWEAARSPWGLLKTVLARIDPVADVHLGTGPAYADAAPATGAAATPRAALLQQPCGGPDCDGHGWINSTDDAGYLTARPCPDCPPRARANHEYDDHAADPVSDAAAEPPF